MMVAVAVKEIGRAIIAVRAGCFFQKRAHVRPARNSVMTGSRPEKSR